MTTWPPAERVNAEALERVRATGGNLQVDGTVIEARPVDGLVEAAGRSGLLVLGTRGHGSLTGAILGATSLEVLHQASSPIMIVD